MRYLFPFLIGFLVINLIGCVSTYRDELQQELDRHNRDVMGRLQMGAISFYAAEQQIEDEWEVKRQLLANHNFQLHNTLNAFWDGVFTTLKFGLAIASSFVPVASDLSQQMGSLALESLKTRITQHSDPALPPQTFTLPPDFVHIYHSLDSQTGKTKTGNIFYPIKGKKIWRQAFPSHILRP